MITMITKEWRTQAPHGLIFEEFDNDFRWTPAAIAPMECDQWPFQNVLSAKQIYNRTLKAAITEYVEKQCIWLFTILTLGQSNSALWASDD